MSDAPGVGRRAPRRKLRTFAVTLLILIGGSAAVLLVMHLIGRSAVAAREAAIRAAGDPLTFEELFARRPKIPDDQNSALILQALRARLDAIDAAAKAVEDTLPVIGNATLPGVGEPHERETVNTVEKFVADHRDLLWALDALRDRPRGSFDSNVPKDPISWLLPHLKSLRTAAKLEALAGLNDALHGRTDEGLARARLILNIAATVEHEGVLISTLVMSACDASAAAHVERVLSIGSASPAELRAVSDAIKRHEKSDSLVWGMWGERIAQRSMFDWMRTGKAQAMMVPPPPAPSPVLRVFSGWTAMNEAKTLGMMSRKVEIARSPENKTAELAAFDRQMQAMSPFYVLTRMALPSLTRSIQIWNRRTAALRCARTAIAAELHRIETGGWPATFEQLVPVYLDAVPLDPFDGKPLRYLVSDEGIVIYSIGDDGTDEGGAIARENDRRPTDVGFRLLAPELRVVRIVESVAAPTVESPSADSHPATPQ